MPNQKTYSASRKWPERNKLKLARARAKKSNLNSTFLAPARASGPKGEKKFKVRPLAELEEKSDQEKTKMLAPQARQQLWLRQYALALLSPGSRHNITQDNITQHNIV